MSNNLFNFELIGFGVMGKSILLNTTDLGFSVTGFDRDLIRNAALKPAEGITGIPDLSQQGQQRQQPRQLFRYK
jgi:6-phosphogluconate dehydrogenase